MHSTDLRILPHTDAVEDSTYKTWCDATMSNENFHHNSHRKPFHDEYPRICAHQMRKQSCSRNAARDKKEDDVDDFPPHGMPAL